MIPGWRLIGDLSAWWNTRATQLKARGKLPGSCTALSRPDHLYGPYYSTGDQFEKFREQGLVVKTKTGGVLITGCGHPGPVEMVDFT